MASLACRIGPDMAVAHVYYVEAMGTTTVRLDAADEQVLDRLAQRYGGRSNAIRQALRSLASDVDQQDGLAAFVQEWELTVGPIDPVEVEAMTRRFGL